MNKKKFITWKHKKKGKKKKNIKPSHFLSFLFSLFHFLTVSSSMKNQDTQSKSQKNNKTCNLTFDHCDITWPVS
jgi:hypothetical protein